MMGPYKREQSWFQKGETPLKKRGKKRQKPPHKKNHPKKNPKKKKKKTQPPKPQKKPYIYNPQKKKKRNHHGSADNVGEGLEKTVPQPLQRGKSAQNFNTKGRGLKIKGRCVPVGRVGKMQRVGGGFVVGRKGSRRDAGVGRKRGGTGAK